MITVICALIVLLIGYMLYGRLVERVFAPDDRKTPAYTKEDGVDFVPMKTWKAFLVQLLNIAGTGPIFGALMGACFGPVVFLWIVLGAILGGGVHDYMSGMISERHDGASIAELSGIYLGAGARWIMRLFSVLLLLLTGTVFVTSPAALLARLTPGSLNLTFWIVLILAYYILATLLPIDKVIGRLYPVFGVVLIVMAAGILFGIVRGGYAVPELTLANLHPEGLPLRFVPLQESPRIPVLLRMFPEDIPGNGQFRRTAPDEDRPCRINPAVAAQNRPHDVVELDDRPRVHSSRIDPVSRPERAEHAVGHGNPVPARDDGCSALEGGGHR